MKQFKIPVVAESGALQKALGLQAVKRTCTYDYKERPDSITIRTFLVPTPTQFGSYALYFTPKNEHRCVINIYEHNERRVVNGKSTGFPTGRRRFQIMGSATDETLEMLLTTAKEIDRQVDIKMRGKRSLEVEDPEEELASTRWA